jgi:hypothetical protein
MSEIHYGTPPPLNGHVRCGCKECGEWRQKAKLTLRPKTDPLYIISIEDTTETEPGEGDLQDSPAGEPKQSVCLAPRILTHPMGTAWDGDDPVGVLEGPPARRG